MKRDLLLIAEQMLPLLDERRLKVVARNRGIKPKEGESGPKLLTEFLRKADCASKGNPQDARMLSIWKSRYKEAGEGFERLAVSGLRING